MKKKSYLTIIFIGFLLMQTPNTYAQFNTQNGGPGNWWGQTNNQNQNNTIRRVGIGDFSQTQGPRAALNIDANLLVPLISTAGNNFLPGEVFRTDGPSNNMNAWRLWTGGQNPEIPATEKFALFVPGNSDNVFLRASATASRMFLYTGGVSAANQRMIISQAPGTNTPRVGIGNNWLTLPETYLHVGTNITPNGGFRPWMDIGTLYNHQSDNMYVGLRNWGNDRHDAIINWGNNPVGGSYPYDRLRFVFTAYTNAGVDASGIEGLEIARMITDGNNGFVGIGDFLTAGFEPMHRLTIMHDSYPVLGIINDRPINDPNNMKLELALAMGNGYYSNVAVAGDGVLRANGNATRNMIISARNYNDGNIRFTTGNATTEAERMRVSFNGNVGVGDFIALGQDPTHRIDVDGNARIRELPSPLWHDNSIDKIVVVDNAGVLHWRDASTLGSGTGVDFDWEHLPEGVFSGHPNTGGYNPTGVWVGVPPALVPTLEYPVKFGVLQVDGGTGATGLVGSVCAGFRNDWAHSIPYITSREFGVYSQAVGNGLYMGSKTFNYGGRFEAKNANLNIGGHFMAMGTTIDEQNIGILAEIPWPYAAGDYSGFFYGDVFVNGDVYRNNCTSDQKFKTNITPYSNAINQIVQLATVTFNYNSNLFPHLNFTQNQRYGLIAQEVELIFPDMIRENIMPAKYDSIGNLIHDTIHFKDIEYDLFIPVLIRGVQELAIENDSLKNELNSIHDRINNLENILMQCCNNDKNEQQPSFSQTVTVSNQKAIVLNQNSPNPFKEQTSITFQIPEYVKSAQIVFIDNLGNILNQVEITERGYGELVVYAQDLSSGLYTYYLVADGKTIESKKMVVAK